MERERERERERGMRHVAVILFAKRMRNANSERAFSFARAGKRHFQLGRILFPRLECSALRVLTTHTLILTGESYPIYLIAFIYFNHETPFLLPPLAFRLLAGRIQIALGPWAKWH